MSGMLRELTRAGLYKRTQGKITRQVTFAAAFISIAMGCWQLKLNLSFIGGRTQAQYTLSGYVIPAVLLAMGTWFLFRLVNYPRFADFLIAVEAEMSKVNWPSRRELFRASMVVLVTIFVLALVLFFYDMAWRVVLKDLLNIHNAKTP